MSWMRSVALFLAGIVVGTLVMQTSAAQHSGNTGHRLNFMGLRVKDFQESLNFYTKVMGFKEVYTIRNPDGTPGNTFLQINRETFIKIQQATATAPVALTNIGLYTDDINATVAELRKAGATVTDPRASTSNGSNSILAIAKDPNGFTLEINQQPAGSLMRKAIDAWK